MKEQEIRFRKSLYRFFTIVFFTVVLATAFNLFIQQLPLEDQIEEALTTRSLKNIKLHQPSLGFKKGLLPAFTLIVNRMEWADPKCQGRKLLAQNIVAPIKLVALIQGDLRLGRLLVEFIDYTEPPSCSSKARPSLLAQATSHVEESTSAKPERTDPAPQWGLAFEKWGSQIPQSWPLGGLKVEQLNFYKPVQGRDLQISGRLQLDLKSAPQLFFDISQIQFEKRVLPFRNTEVSAHLRDKSLAVGIKTRVREGRARLDARLPFQASESGRVAVNLEKLPLSHLSAHFLKENRLAYLWWGCQAHQEAPLDDMLTQFITFESCEITGPYGNVVLKEAQVSFSDIKTLAIEVKQLQLDQVVKNRRQAYLSGVFSQFGTLSQEMRYHKGVFESQGELEKAELLFSRRSQRELQKVGSLSFRIKGAAEDWQAHIGELDLEGGGFRGEVKLQRKPERDLVQGKVSFHRLQMSPAIYRLLFRSEPTDLSLYGDFNFKGDQLLDWSLIAATSHVQGDHYRIENLKVRGEGSQNQLADIKVTASRGEILEASELKTWLRPTTLDGAWEEDAVIFKELSVHMSVRKDRRLQWERGYVRLKNGWQLSTEGARQQNRSVEAWLQWDRPDGRYLKWSYEGEFFKGVWRPETSWVKSWLWANQDFLQQHKQIQFDDSGEGS